jgi:hypothetical protein
MHDPDLMLHRRATARGILLTAVAAGCLLTSAGGAGAAEGDGTIAYLSSDRREVRLVEPDGTNDRLLWAVADPDAMGIQDIAFSPDGAELALASAHEATCSVWHSDLYRLAAAGGEPHRITNAPGCQDLGGYPTGSVSLDLVNDLVDQSIFVVYVQGAPVAEVVTLQPGFGVTLTFPGVADLGEGVLQTASAAVGSTRWLDAAVFADVIPGSTVHAGTLLLSSTAYDSFGALTASWSPDATRLAFQLGQGLLWSVAAEPPLLDGGTALFADGPTGVLTSDPVYSPVDPIVAYNRYDSDPSVIEVAQAGAELPGTAWAGVTLARGIAWFTDGSGLVVADQSLLDGWTNLYLVRFDDGSVQPLTGLPAGEHAWWPSLSPDGRRIAYTHVTGNPDDPGATVELRVLDLASGTATTIGPAGLQPSWGAADVP